MTEDTTLPPDNTPAPAAQVGDTPTQPETTQTPDKPDVQVGDTPIAPVGDTPSADKPADAPPATPELALPENWRQILAEQAGGDVEKNLKMLSRFKGIGDVFNSFKNIYTKVSSGTHKEGPPKDATPEQLKEWREEQGLPLDPKDYLKALPEGYVYSESEQKAIDDYAKTMYDMNVPADVVAQSIKAQVALQEAAAIELQKADEVNCEDVGIILAEEWGGKFQHNMTKARQVLDFAFGKEFAEDFLNKTRFGDKTALQHTPEFWRGLANLSNLVREVPTNVGTPQDGDVKTIESRYTEIKDIMRKDFNGYHKNKPLQDEFGALIKQMDALKIPRN